MKVVESIPAPRRMNNLYEPSFTATLRTNFKELKTELSFQFICAVTLLYHEWILDLSKILLTDIYIHVCICKR